MGTVSALDAPRAARLFHALSDEIRIDVIVLLLRGERCVCELTSALDLAQPRLSWHLKTLKDAGLVNDRREGRWIYYSLDPKALEEAEAMLTFAAARARKVKTRSGCC